MSWLSAYARSSWRRFAQRSPIVFWSTAGLAAVVVTLFVLLPSRKPDRREIPGAVVEEKRAPARGAGDADDGRIATPARTDKSNRAPGDGEAARSKRADAAEGLVRAERAPRAVPPSSSPEASGGYTVQVGSFASGESARQVAAQLEASGYPAFVKAAEIPGKGRTYRVRVGAFATREEAQRFGHRLVAGEKSVKSVLATVND